jgi:hypothetical protein
MNEIEELEVAVREALDQTGKLVMSQQLLTKLGFPRLTAWLGTFQQIELTKASVSRPSGALLVSGALTHAKLGEVVVSCEVVINDGAPSSKVRWVIVDAPKLDAFLAKVGLEVAAAAGALTQAITTQAVRIQEQHGGTLAVSLEIAGSLSINLGAATLRLTLTSVAFTNDGDRVSQIRGTVELGKLSLPVIATIADDFRVTAVAPALSVADLAATLGIQFPPLPAIPLLTSAVGDLQIDFGPPLRIGARTPLAGLGALVLAWAQTASGPVLAVALEPLPGFKFSSLHQALTPFDVLLEVVSFGTPSVVIASDDASNFYLPDASGGWQQLSVTKGAAIFGELLLKGLGLDVVGMLTGLGKIPFGVALDVAIAQSRLIAHVPNRLEPLPGVISVDDFRIEATLEPYRLAASGKADVILLGQKLPEFVLGVSLSDGRNAIYLASAAPWKDPAGLPLTVEKVALQLAFPPPTFGIAGDILVAGRELRAATEFIGEAPTMLAAAAKGDLSLEAILRDTLGVSLLPDYFVPALRDPEIYLVLNPLGVTIADEHFPPGLGIAGRAGYLGFELLLRLSGKPDRVFGEARFTGPVRVLDVLEITGSGGSGAAHFSFDSGPLPSVVLDARIAFLGLAQEIKGTVSVAGVAFTVSQDLGIIKTHMDVLLGENQLAASGSIEFGLKARIGPLRIANGPDLGTIKLDTTFSGDVSLRGDAASGVTLAVKGAFEVMGITIQLPTLSLSPKSFADVPQAILDFIAKHAEALFADLLKPDVWLKAIANAIVEGVENIARGLRDHFQQSAEQIARGLHDTLNYTAEQSAQALQAIQESADNVGRALSSIGVPVGEITTALKTVGYAPEAIGGALKALGQAPDDARKLLEAAGVPAAVVASAINSVFGAVLGGGVFVKIPTPDVFIKVPHLKTPHIKGPHLKSPF